MKRHISKIQHGDGRHFENHFISISQPQIVRISRNLVCRHKLYPGDGNVKFRNSKWRIENPPFWKLKIENHFLAITSLHIVPLRWNLEWGGRITRIQNRSGMIKVPNYENPKQWTSTFWKWIYLRIWAASRPNDEIWHTNANFDTDEETWQIWNQYKKSKYNL